MKKNYIDEQRLSDIIHSIIGYCNKDLDKLISARDIRGFLLREIHDQRKEVPKIRHPMYWV